MSTLDEIKNAVTSLPPEQQLELDSFIWSLRKVPVIYSATVDERMREMDAGNKVPWKEVRERMIANERLSDDSPE
jgi:hypothetical protein